MRLRIGLVWLATLLYPLVVYLGLGRVEPRWMALFLLVMVLARAIVSRDAVWLGAAAGASLLAIVSFLGNQSLPLKLYPVLVSVVMLAVFGLSLRHPPSAIERIARIHEPDLPPEAVAYTRKVTGVWCVFFIVNGCVSLMTALWGSDRVWALYNGVISYALMGILFVGEWLLRHRLRARSQHG
jgi:uncharacterized membrane protein